MARTKALISIAGLLCLEASACESLDGLNVPPAPAPAPAPERATGAPAAARRPPVATTPTGRSEAPVVAVLLPADAGPLASSDGGDAGTGDTRPAPVARPIVADGPAIYPPRVGFDGGAPRSGTCPGGVAIGVRTTANPSDAIFGARLTFIEPICGRLLHQPSTLDDPAQAQIASLADDSLLAWDDTGDFQGEPLTQAPDPRLTWEPQPPTLCPETAPVLVGVFGAYDRAAPEVADTAAIRSLAIECAPVSVGPDGVSAGATDAGHQFISQADSFAARGNDSYRTFCDAGTVVTGIQVSSGYWLDGFVLACSSLHSPRLAGEPCSTGLECQSAECLPEGACGPGEGGAR